MLICLTCSCLDTGSSLINAGSRRTDFVGNNSPLATIFPQATGHGRLRAADLLIADMSICICKQILRDGKPGDTVSTLPFKFEPINGAAIIAQNAGLEGFLFTEDRAARLFGRSSLWHHASHYIEYLQHLFGDAQHCRLSGELDQIQQSTASAQEKYDAVMRWARNVALRLRQRVKDNDGAIWVRKSRINEIFPRVFNLDGFRAAHRIDAVAGGKFFADMTAADIEALKGTLKTANTLYVMGIFEIGERGALGTAGGSPFSIKDHLKIHPELGTMADLAQFVRRAHSVGVKVIIDLVLNHTSLDSKLLLEHPEYFIQKPIDSENPQDPPEGYFHHKDPRTNRDYWIACAGYYDNGKKTYWADVAQLNLANVDARRTLIDLCNSLICATGVDGFRVDMAYGLFRDIYESRWDTKLPTREFLEELITTIHEKHPRVAFIAEGYGLWDEMSAAGFGLIYFKNHMSLRGGGHHYGLYDALAQVDRGAAHNALSRLEFLRWQVGGADALVMTGNHDEPSPQRAFGKLFKAAVLLSFLIPGAHMHYTSQETGLDDPHYDGKAVPFTKPVQINWRNPDQTIMDLYVEALGLVKYWHQNLGLTMLYSVDQIESNPNVISYALVNPEELPDGPVGVILVNTGDRTERVTISSTELTLIATEVEIEPHGIKTLVFKQAN